jgi:hypothetical protein
MREDVLVAIAEFRSEVLEVPYTKDDVIISDVFYFYSYYMDKFNFTDFITDDVLIEGADLSLKYDIDILEVLSNYGIVNVLDVYELTEYEYCAFIVDLKSIIAEYNKGDL